MRTAWAEKKNHLALTNLQMAELDHNLQKINADFCSDCSLIREVDGARVERRTIMKKLNFKSFYNIVIRELPRKLNISVDDLSIFCREEIFQVKFYFRNLGLTFEIASK